MELRCSRCGVIARNGDRTCRGCGAPLGGAPVAGDEPDYYALFELSPQMSFAEIRARLDEATRKWAGVSTNAAALARRQEAERLLDHLDRARVVLLNAAARADYDARWRQRQSGRRAPSSGSARPAGHSVVVPRRASDPPVAGAPDRGESEPVRTADLDVQTNWLGWTTIRGTVIHIDPMYTIPPPRNWPRIVLALVLAPVLILLGVILLSFRMALRIMYPRLAPEMHGGGLFLLLLTLCRAGGARPQVAVRDLRVRDSGGNEHSVRLMGQLLGAAVNVGDEVTLSGFCRGGTLNVRRGINHRTRSVIQVRA